MHSAHGDISFPTSNFPTAMLDLAIKSTDKADEGLLFEPWTERVPPKGTEVIMELIPVPEKTAPKSPPRSNDLASRQDQCGGRATQIPARRPA